MRAHFVDVGQGARSVLEFSTGIALIDTGAQDDEHVDKLVDYLHAIVEARPDLENTIDLVITTHPHIDHTRGLRQVCETFRVLHYVDNGNLTGSGNANPQWIRDKVSRMELNTLIRTARDAEIVGLSHKNGLTDNVIDPITAEDCDPQIVVLSGGLDDDPGWGEDEFKNQNNHSVVIRVDFGEASFLFTGDLEEEAIHTMIDYYDGTGMLDVDVYQVGHHASHNATSTPFLDVMTPEYAFIGVGKWTFGKGERNPFTTFRFGHPRKVTVDRLVAAIPGDRDPPKKAMVATAVATFEEQEITKNVYATGWDGNVVLTAGADGVFEVTTDMDFESQPDVLPLFAGTGRRSTSRVPSAESPRAAARSRAAVVRPRDGSSAAARTPAAREVAPTARSLPIKYNYKIVQASNAKALEAEVVTELREGWQPTGGIAVQQLGDDKQVLLQALTR